MRAPALIWRDELTGLHCVHQQLELGQLEGPAGQIITAAPAPVLYNVVAQRPQGGNVVVNAFALGGDALGGQQLQNAGHIDQMFLIGIAGKNAQQNCHGNR